MITYCQIFQNWEISETRRVGLLLDCKFALFFIKIPYFCTLLAAAPNYPRIQTMNIDNSLGMIPQNENGLRDIVILFRNPGNMQLFGNSQGIDFRSNRMNLHENVIEGVGSKQIQFFVENSEAFIIAH